MMTTAEPPAGPRQGGGARRTQALLITGTVGAGKSTTAELVGRRLCEAGTPYAVIDLDEIRRCWPVPPGDPFGMAVQLENLTAMSATFRRHGAHRLVLAGVVETSADRQLIEAAVGVPLAVCRLRLALELVRARLTERHADDLEAQVWHLHRAEVLEDILDANQVADRVVEIDGLAPGEVADRVLTEVGWRPANAV